MEKVWDVLIVGGGPAGYTAALYAARAGLDAVVLERLCPGGQMALTSHIENYPGFDSVDGFTLGQHMKKGAESAGAKTVLTQVTQAELTGTVKRLHTPEGTFLGKTVILAMGASSKKLGLPMEEALTGRGVHYCGTCDGMFYRGQTVALVGGGNSAVEDGLQLSRTAKEVLLIHRRDTLRASESGRRALLSRPNVTPYWDSQVTALLGEDGFRGIRIRNLKTGQERELSCAAVFVSIGRTPATEIVKDMGLTDPSGYLVADESTVTAIPGVFAAGDARAKAVRQIVTAVSDGASAALAAEKYLQEKGTDSRNPEETVL